MFFTPCKGHVTSSGRFSHKSQPLPRHHALKIEPPYPLRIARECRRAWKLSEKTPVRPGKCNRDFFFVLTTHTTCRFTLHTILSHFHGKPKIFFTLEHLWGSLGILLHNFQRHYSQLARILPRQTIEFTTQNLHAETPSWILTFLTVYPLAVESGSPKLLCGLTASTCGILCEILPAKNS